MKTLYGGAGATWTVHLLSTLIILFVGSRSEQIEKDYFELDVSEPEKLEGLEIRACTAQSTLEETQRLYVELPDSVTLKWCLTIETSKNANDAAAGRQQSTQFEPTVNIQWWRMALDVDAVLHQQTSCSVEFKGFLGSYRVSPDLGYYRECNHELSKYRGYLASRAGVAEAEGVTPAPYANITDQKCPLKRLPALQSQYAECQLELNRWYLLNFTSSLFVERLTANATYEMEHIHWSQMRVFRPSATTVQSGRQWLKRLIHTSVRRGGCAYNELLVVLDKDWQWPVSIDLYQISVNDSRYKTKSTRYVSSATVTPSSQPWTTLPLGKSVTAYQLCLNLTSAGHRLTADRHLYCVDQEGDDVDTLGECDVTPKNTINGARSFGRLFFTGGAQSTVLGVSAMLTAFYFNSETSFTL